MSRNLRPVPEVAPRALGIIRVSKEREGMISPELQWTAIEDHCTRMGYELAGRLEGIDESGSSRRSPWWRRLDQAIERVESGEFQVIVVWKFSRTARNRMRWAVALDRVDVAGGRLESATEPVDVSTSAGRLARGVLAEFNAFEAERIGEIWKDVHSRRVEKGLPANGKPRWGYRLVDGAFVPDPETGPVLASLYRRYVAGESVYTLVEWLNAEGYRTAPGYSPAGPGPWTQMTLRRVLDSGFGAGYFTRHGQLVRGAHVPVIDAATWTAYRAARAARRTARSSERSRYLLSGLVRCACGSPMGGGQFGQGRVPKFRCVAAAQERRHPGGYVTMRVVEDAVRTWLEGLASDVDASADAVLAQQAKVARRRNDAKRFARELVAIDRELTNLTVHLAQELIPPAAYAAARDEIEKRRAAVEGRMLQAEADTAGADAREVASDLLAHWDEWPVEQRRGILRGLVARIVVTPQRPLSTVDIVPTWAGD